MVYKSQLAICCFLSNRMWLNMNLPCDLNMQMSCQRVRFDEQGRGSLLFFKVIRQISSHNDF